jgi:hypothetical protein
MSGFFARVLEKEAKWNRFASFHFKAKFFYAKPGTLFPTGRTLDFYSMFIGYC